MSATLELLARREGAEWVLLAPRVGLFTGALAQGAALTSGVCAGYLLELGRRHSLRVPEGVTGVIVRQRSERTRTAVSFGELLYRLTPLSATTEPTAQAQSSAELSGSALVFRSPQTGRFYHRPAPTEAAYVKPGDRLEAGSPLGLIEVMKTFTHVSYRPTLGLPARVRFLRYLAPHASDVREGQALCELEPD